MEQTKELKLAVLIDADNVPYSNVKGMMEEIAKYGTPTFKRIYGDWTKPTLSGWKKVLLDNAITPVQQYSYTTGKNSSDSALIIDAMDILYTGGMDGFCIVSSDSDFTRLATRLREGGMKVFGIGEKKTPSSFIASCHKFIYIEILEKKKDKEFIPAKAKEKSKSSKQAKGMSKQLEVPELKEEPKEEIKEPVRNYPDFSPIDADLIRLISDSINDLADEEGYVFLGVLGNLILKKQPDFDSRNYGYKKLVDIIKKIPSIEIDERRTGKNHVAMYVKNRES
ncbi:MAG: NYN domain-containing protein [Bacteroidota bacterium]